MFCIGSTAAVGAIEFEPGLQHDLPEMLDRLIPPRRDYGHEQAWHDGNGHSHLQATLMGPSLSVPVAEGNPHRPFAKIWAVMANKMRTYLPTFPLCGDNMPKIAGQTGFRARRRWFILLLLVAVPALIAWHAMAEPNPANGPLAPLKQRAGDVHYTKPGHPRQQQGGLS